MDPAPVPSEEDDIPRWWKVEKQIAGKGGELDDEARGYILLDEVWSCCGTTVGTLFIKHHIVW